MKYQRKARRLAKRVGNFIMTEIGAYFLILFLFCGCGNAETRADWEWLPILSTFILAFSILSVLFFIQFKENKIKREYIKAYKNKNRQKMYCLELDAMWIDQFEEAFRDFFPNVSGKNEEETF